MNKKVIVTGATGFLGKKLCKALKQRNITTLELNSEGHDIADKNYFDQVPDGKYDHFYHLAAKTFVPDSWADPLAFIKTNTLGTVNALEFCKPKNIPVTFVSAFVYGNVANPIQESTVPEPNNPYALSKKLAEDLCLFYERHHKLAITVVRPFNIYGPGQPGHFLIPSIIKQAILNGNVTVGDLAPRRDYIYIDDVTDLLCKMIENRATGIFNAGTGNSYSVAEVIGLIEKIIGKKIEIQSAGNVRKNEIMDTVASISSARDAFDWYPAWTLEKGLMATVQAISANLQD
jgi:nucleoside-diphosphate-sugar epimerase